MTGSPTIEPIKTKEYTCKQSKYGDIVPGLPTRATLLAPSFPGKTVLISNLILDVYKNCFNRIYMVSPTINIDDNWIPVKRYIEKEIKPREDEQVCFDHYNPEDLQDIVELQYKVIEYQKTHGHKQLFQITILFMIVLSHRNFYGIVECFMLCILRVDMITLAQLHMFKCIKV